MKVPFLVHKFFMVYLDIRIDAFINQLFMDRKNKMSTIMVLNS